MPSSWSNALLVAAALVAVPSVLLTLNWLFATGKTDPRLLGAPFVVRTWRRVRRAWFRVGLELFAWPHVVELPLGTRRAPVAQMPSEVVWEKNGATLRHYPGASAEGAAVLVVHSLVSRPWILDLAPGRSFIEFLGGEGFDVFLLDWGDPDAATAGHGLSACSDVLMQAEDEVLKRTRSDRLHLVGYCLAGWCAYCGRARVATITSHRSPHLPRPSTSASRWRCNR